MYEVTFIRLGTYPHINRKGRGEFRKSFETLADLAEYLENSYPRVCVKEYHFPKAERVILWYKYKSLREKRLKIR